VRFEDCVADVDLEGRTLQGRVDTALLVWPVEALINLSPPAPALSPALPAAAAVDAAGGQSAADGTDDPAGFGDVVAEALEVAQDHAEEERWRGARRAAAAVIRAGPRACCPS
jgi:hypothetical protein